MAVVDRQQQANTRTPAAEPASPAAERLTDPVQRYALQDAVANRALIDPLQWRRGSVHGPGGLPRAADEVQVGREGKESDEEKGGCKGTMQRVAGAPAPVQRVSISSSGGSPLDEGVRGKMEDAMGTDFSSVRVHQASSAAPKLGALAFTQGENIHFAPGAYSTQTLGHELAHVVQQRQGRVKPTGSVNGVALNDDPSLEAEADRIGAAVRG